MKKAIVTGATGFIGKFLVRELVKQNVEVIAVVRRGTKNLNTINALPVKIVECRYSYRNNTITLCYYLRFE